MWPADRGTYLTRHWCQAVESNPQIKGKITRNFTLKVIVWCLHKFRRLRMCLGSVVLESENTRKAFPEAEQCRKHNRPEMLAFPDTREREATWFRTGLWKVT